MLQFKSHNEQNSSVEILFTSIPPLPVFLSETSFSRGDRLASARALLPNRAAEMQPHSISIDLDQVMNLI